MPNRVEKTVYLFIRFIQVALVVGALLGAMLVEQHLFDESMGSSITSEVSDE